MARVKNIKTAVRENDALFAFLKLTNEPNELTTSLDLIFDHEEKVDSTTSHKA